MNNPARDTSRLLLAFAGITLMLHLAANVHGGYGIFRDELYYLASTRYLDIGYVDHPPLSIWVLALNVLLFGQSVFALRLIPALLGAATVYMTGMLTRELGGGRSAQITACGAALAAPILLGMFGYYSMNSFDLLFWSVSFFLVLRLLRAEDSRSWIVLGFVLGLGLLNKVGMLWFGTGFFAAIMLTDRRHWLLTPWPWVAAGIAFLLFLPYILWNVSHDLAHLEFIRNAAGEKYASQNPLTFFSGLVVINNPVAMPLWIAGFWLLLKNKAYRFPGIIVLAVLAILIINVHSKAEYYSGAMLMLFAAGGVQFERWTDSLRRRWVRIAYPALIAVSGLALLPMTIDILPVETFLQYQSALGIAPPSTEGHRLNGLPQHYADRFGWKELASTVALVYHSLPPGDRTGCAIYGSNYGEAAAIDVYGGPLGLPKAYSQHNSYFFWGLERDGGEHVWIIIGGPEEELRREFDSVAIAAVLRAPWAMPYENNAPILVCRGLKAPRETVWREGKHFE